VAGGGAGVGASMGTFRSIFALCSRENLMVAG
jgi:hypothetical protein